MKKFVDVIYKINKGIMLLFVLLNLTAIYGITQINIETSFDIFKISDSKYVENLGVLEEEFPVSDQLIVVTEYTKENEEILKQFENEMNSLSTVRSVKGLGSEGLLPIDIPELSSIKEVDGKEYLITTIFPTEDFGIDELNQIDDYFEEVEIDHYIAGDKYMQNKIFDYLLFILLTIPPVVLIVLFTIFKAQMKSFKATLLSVLPAGVAALWTLGFAGLLGNQVSMLTVLAPIFTIIIGSADGLHFISHIQEHLEDGYTMKESITHSLSMVGVPMIITTVTSVAGFLALLTMNTAAIYDLAYFASIGITLAGLITFIILPTVNSFDKINIRLKPNKKGINIPFNKLFGWPSYLIAVIIIALSFFGLPHIKTEFNQLMLYKDYTDVAKGSDKIMDVNDGTIPLFVLLENDETVAIRTNDLIQSLEESGYVTKTVSIYSLQETIYNALPENFPVERLNIQELSLYRELVSDNYTKVILFPKDMLNETIDGIKEIVEEDETNLFAGTQVTMNELNAKMIEGQKLSLALAFALVFLSLLISLRKFSVSVFAMVPILLTTLFLFTFLGLSGISLNLFTSTIFSITIGVGIDYAIHYASIYRTFRKQGLNSDDAVDKAYAFSSRPIIANAVGFSLALTALMISPLKVHVYISTLMWVSMLLSSLLSLSLLPTILRKLKH